MAVERLAGYAFESPVLRITNRTRTFFHDVRARVHLDGDVRDTDFHEWDDRLTYDLSSLSQGALR